MQEKIKKQSKNNSADSNSKLIDTLNEKIKMIKKAMRKKIMQEKTKTQNGFIQIPLLIAIIVSIIGASVATTGAILHKQGKLAPFITNISQVFKGTEDVKPEIKSEEPQPQVEQSLLEEVSQESNLQAEQELKETKLEAEKAKQETEKVKAENEQLKAKQQIQAIEKQQQEAQRITQEKQKQAEADALKKTQEEAKIKAEQELQGQQEQAQTKIYADSIIKACGLIINQCEILKSYNTDEVINLIDIRINGLNELKTTNAKYFNIVEFQTLDKILDSQIEFAKASRVLVVNLETAQATEKNCQEIINNVNDISKTMQTLILYKGKNKAKITEDDFNQYWGFLQGYQNGINKFWDVIKSGNANVIQAFKESVDSQDARLKTFLSSIEQGYSVPIPSGTYYSPSQNRFLEDYYLQEQSKSLQNMSDSLRGILDMVRFQYAPRL